MSLSDQHIRTLRLLAVGTPLEAARDWMINAHIRNSAGTGWPHFTGQGSPSVWGGTLDGILALSRAGVDRHNPLIADSLEWLWSQQREDGGFGSREIGYSAAEPTAWVLFMLSEIGYPRKDCAKSIKALEFLETCISDDGWAGTAPGEEARTYPTWISLLALHQHSTKANLVAAALKTGRDNQGGWGIRPQTAATVGITAQVLYALVRTEQALRSDGVFQEALSYLRNRENWANSVETWYGSAQPHIPLSCHSDFASWCLRAFIASGVEVRSPDVAELINRLIRSQTEGYWLYDPLDNSQNIWCVSGNVWALADARKALLEQVFDIATHEVAERRSGIGHVIQEKGRDGIRWLRSNSLYIIVSALVLWVFRKELSAGVGSAASPVLGFLNVERANILVELLGNSLWIIAAWFLVKLLKMISPRSPTRGD